MGTQRALLIAEKPSVANDIRNAYEKIKSSLPYEIDFTSCAGHLVGLCDPDEYKAEWGTPWTKDVLPMIPETWKTKVINSKFYDSIKAMWEAGDYDVIINAGDAGREGQLIQWLVYNSLGINVPVLRYWADDTTEKTIIKTLNNLVPDENYKGLTEASFLRLYFDWLIGINFSRAGSLSLGRPTILGRVLAPTLALACNRENEIINFKPVNYFELEASFKTANNKEYKGNLLNPNANDKSPSKYAYLDKNELENIMKIISGINNGVITEVTEEDKVFRAPTLFNLPDLQKECSNKYGFTPAKTLEYAQKLYEDHYLSYPRTESKCLTTEQAKEMPNLINSLSSISIFKPYIDDINKNSANISKALNSKKYVDDKKVSDHPALTPTDVIPSLDSLSDGEKKVYTLVVCRFLSIFMPENIITQTAITTTLTSGDNEYNFRSTGSVEKQAGWKEIMKLVSSTNKNNTESLLPKVIEGDNVLVGDLGINDKKTNPPKRYDNATIIEAMETAGRQLDDEELEKVLMACAGLGTPATRAEILEKLVKYQYIERKGKTIYPTEQGMDIIKALDGRKIISPELTAIWEKKLKEVETGVITYDAFYNAMIKYINAETSSLFELKSLGAYFKKIGVCPKCKKDFIVTSKFYACKGYFEKEGETRLCDFGLPLTYGKRPLTETDVKSLISGEMTKPKEYTWSSGKKSTTSLILTEDFKIGFPNREMTREVVGKCPCCKGDVVKGKTGYYCEKWNDKDENGNPKCSFSVFGKIGETDISSKAMTEILINGETSKEYNVRWKTGKTYPGKLTLELTDEGKYRISIKAFEERDVCTCPSCGVGTLKEEKFKFVCDNIPSRGGSCLVSIPKSFMGSTISEEEAIKLIKGEKITGKTFISKEKKKPYKANVYAVIDEQKGMILKMEFTNNYKKK